MPHHQSRQQHPMGGASFPSPVMRTGFVPGRLDYRSDGLMAMPHRGVPHPRHTMQTWIPAPGSPHLALHPSSSHEQIVMSMSGEDQSMIHRLPTVRKSRSSDCTSPASMTSSVQRYASPKQDYSSTIAKDAGSPYNSPRHMAASSVLMLSQETPSSDREGSPSIVSQRSRPLKKRKPFATSSAMPCHVSPMSQQTSPDTPLTSSSRSSPYEDEHDQPEAKKARTESSRSASGASDSPVPPSQVIIPHFPSILHMLLSAPTSSKVVQWLEHGKAWRIVRWEGLRREILPQFFPQLREEDQSGSASIDAFLKHLGAWGFKEITDGADAGAYSHEVCVTYFRPSMNDSSS